ncbi:MAG: alpha-L-fucosidase [Rudaea sp.]|uniref:alpha-L-fucosidase n=1 Tax=unclassified Rudaea TaxID=2627037 RepID=UPI0010F6E7B1|nr:MULTISPECIES: alpha-L-fucosidase [unclassified Rudaea]MBN8887491.1 alpha-L-fucosidase [Rudaea sp.]MBR0343719.1 alpha-L-fucosidase [Rudaea sp.]
MSKYVVTMWAAAIALLAAGSVASAAVEQAAPAAADGTAAPLSPKLEAWRKLGFGMFVHWGLYSELGGVWQGKPVTKGYSEQIQSWAKIAHADYAKVAERFSAQNFDADAICGLAKDAGARYIVVTSKHHDGFAMFDTKSTDFNVVKRTPFGKDPLKLLSAACRKIGLGFGVYFSLVDWHAGHAFDPNNNNPIPPLMEPLIEEQLRELMTNYGPITEVWFDMSSPTPAQSRKFAAIVRELQPQAAINGRIWNNVGDFVTLGDNEAPPPGLQPPFEVPASIYHETWGYRSWQKREGAAEKVRELVHGLSEARARGGNYLLNIGPKGDGSIVPFEAEVLRGIGASLREHPAALEVGRSAPPVKIVAAAAGGSVRIARDQWSAGTSFGFRNGYETQYPTTIVLSAAVSSPKAHAAMLRFDGVTAPANARYRIAVGDQVREQDAPSLAAGIGPFALPASGTVPLSIRLATPAFPAEDLGLKFDAVQLLPVAAGKESAP